ncbi:unnamed protein product, partial [Didymodactylos carnosus]
LQIAKDQNVDFILLGGDLFHENKPSSHVMLECISLLRKYCLGDKTIEFKLVSDEKINFSSNQTNSFPWANFKDPNLNVSIPVFSIHGNHDDPSGANPLCPLDLLSSCGLVNYFGNVQVLENININPLLFRKGVTNLSIYGLGSIRDERLHRIFLKNQINLLRPTNTPDDWFNIFVIHQNRVAHGPKNYIPEQFLHEFLDIIIWGHEHDCRITPEFNTVQNFYVIQPGSSIATSLSEGEQLQKHVGILKIYKKTFKLEKVPLQTVRQFYFVDIQLSDVIDEKLLTTLAITKLEQKLDKFLTEKINELLDQARLEHTGHPKQPIKPLIRLRIDYTGFDLFDSFNDLRFVQKFADKVANPRTMINLYKKREAQSKSSEIKLDPEAIKISNDSLQQVQRVEDSVLTYFQSTDETNQMRVLGETAMLTALTEYIDKDEIYALNKMVEAEMTIAKDFLTKSLLAEDVELIEEELRRLKKIKTDNDDEQQKQIKDAIMKAKNERLKEDDDDNDDPSMILGDDDGDDNADDDFDDSESKKKKRTLSGDSSISSSTRGRGRGRGSGRGSRGDTTQTKAAPRSRGRKK